MREITNYFLIMAISCHVGGHVGANNVLRSTEQGENVTTDHMSSICFTLCST